MKKQIHVDFYTVESSGSTDLPAVLAAIQALKPETTKNLSLNDNHILRMQSYRAAGDLHEVNMLRIRMDQVPMRASVSGGLAPFYLKDDEGVGEQTALLYSSRLKVIAFQRNRYGVSPSALAYYLRRIEPTQSYEPALVPILMPDAMKKMQKMVEIRRMNVRVSGVVNTSVFGDQVRNYALPSVNKLLDDFKAPVVTITLSAGKERKKKSPLLVGRVRDALTDFLKLSKEPGDHVQQLDATGRDEEGKLETVDLLTEQMTSAEDVDAKNQRTISLDERMRALHSALSKRRKDLESMLVVQ